MVSKWSPEKLDAGTSVRLVNLMEKHKGRWVATVHTANKWGSTVKLRFSYIAQDELGALVAFHRNMKKRGVRIEEDNML